MVKRTIDHAEIQQWVEKNKGFPQVIDDPEAGHDTPGIRINFPNIADPFLPDYVREVSWDEWFEVFDQQQLMFVYEENEGEENISYRFERRDAS